LSVPPETGFSELVAVEALGALEFAELEHAASPTATAATATSAPARLDALIICMVLLVF
jgi:hypothetical protein